MSFPFFPRSLVTTTFGSFVKHETVTDESETHAPPLNERRTQLRRCCVAEDDDVVNGGGEKEEIEVILWNV